jgi:U32 family peptidase
MINHINKKSLSNDGEDEFALPLILAPAGNKNSFLAAIAAGADAVYCGLKQFSARMEAHNFTLEELDQLVRLAREKGVRVYVALNALLKPDDLNHAGKVMDRLSRWVKPDALIVQDLALITLAKQTGFKGELHLSTLANVSFFKALKLARSDLGVDCVVVPRELDIDEIKAMARICPEGLGLEVFVHGALCYGVSGRCYWSSYLGGKSGLRGRCVQPCRRTYAQGNQSGNFFSCLDLSLDVLTKILLPVPNIRAWKIEGRKKGPHYVYYAVKAYRMLRDHVGEPEIKKAALALLSYALGRPGTHYRMLSHRPQIPIHPEGRSASGRFVGKIDGSRKKVHVTVREELLPDDLIRIGYEGDKWHVVIRVNTYIPKKGRLLIMSPAKVPPAKGTPVFLVDRREKELKEMLSDLERELNDIEIRQGPETTFSGTLPRKTKKRSLAAELQVYREVGRKVREGAAGLWLGKDLPTGIRPEMFSKIWWWLDPVIWPSAEDNMTRSIDRVIKNGGRNFVLNAPWQAAFFRIPKSVNLWAGPFCNISNGLAVGTLEKLGFSGAMVSPELGREDLLSLPKQSPLPLGIVLSGHWPVCISRTLSEGIDMDKPFASPKGEQAWIRKYEENYWIYPNWKLDIRDQRNTLQMAGYVLFMHLYEYVPRTVQLKNRPGMWNWDIGLQ